MAATEATEKAEVLAASASDAQWVEDDADLHGGEFFKTTPALFAAVAAVIGDLGPVHRTGKNDAHDYTYLSEADVAGAVGPMLAKHGLCCLPYRVKARHYESGETNRGDPIYTTEILQTYVLAHEDGGAIMLQVYAHANDHQDKGASKAASGAFRDALRRIACVASTDDIETEDVTPAPQPPAPDLEPPQQAAPAPARGTPTSAEDRVRRTKGRDMILGVLEANDVGEHTRDAVIRLASEEAGLSTVTWSEVLNGLIPVADLLQIYGHLRATSSRAPA